MGRLSCAALVIGVTAAVLPARGPAGAALPPRLGAYLDRHVRLDAEERARLMAGEPVSKLLPSDESKEVAVFGGVWIAAPVAQYLASVRDIERFESGDAFRVTKKISSPPRIEDFARLELPQDDIDDLRSCKVADCELKLSAAGIEQMRSGVDWSRQDAADQVNHLARQAALDYVNGYLEGGNARLAVYRDASRPTFVAREFAEMIGQQSALEEYLPAIRRYLLDFPKAPLPGESFLYWQEATFGLKPTIRISHVAMAETPDGAVVASKMLYASHYFWTALEIRALVRDPGRGQGFWFVTESRSRSDGLSGFTGMILRGKVRGEAEKGTESVLTLTKRALEKH